MMTGGMFGVLGWSLFVALFAALGWLVVLVVGASLWSRELRLPGGMLFAAGVLGLVTVGAGAVLQGTYQILLPEAYAAGEGALLTPDVLSVVQGVAWALLDLVQLCAYALLGAAVFVGRPSPD